MAWPTWQYKTKDLWRAESETVTEFSRQLYLLLAGVCRGFWDIDMHEKHDTLSLLQVMKLMKSGKTLQD